MPGQGNYVSEWFGRRVYPLVDSTPGSLEDQQAHRCPFLSAAVGESKDCVKPAASRGICTISSTSNGPRQDWLICPYRTLDPALMESVARRLYGVADDAPILVVPAPTMARAVDRERLLAMVTAGHTAIVYLQNNLGGEISISPTDRSPELAFDITLVQIIERDGQITFGRYGILEVQTMDFHGSYRAVVQNLNDALRLHGLGFHAAVAANPAWLGERIEGPNIANVFKRTFYQIVMKFQIGADETCAGSVLALPAAVWDSWQRHLGRPELTERPDGLFDLSLDTTPTHTPAWIYVFDIDDQAPTSPHPLRLARVIATDAAALIHYAMKVAPEAAVAGAGSADRVLATIRRRIGAWWPELAPRARPIRKTSITYQRAPKAVSKAAERRPEYGDDDE